MRERLKQLRAWLHGERYFRAGHRPFRRSTFPAKYDTDTLIDLTKLEH